MKNGLSRDRVGLDGPSLCKERSLNSKDAAGMKEDKISSAHYAEQHRRTRKKTSKSLLTIQKFLKVSPMKAMHFAG